MGGRPQRRRFQPRAVTSSDGRPGRADRLAMPMKMSEIEPNKSSHRTAAESLAGGAVDAFA